MTNATAPTSWPRPPDARSLPGDEAAGRACSSAQRAVGARDIACSPPVPSCRCFASGEVGLGLSQEALAEAIGDSARSVNRWEQGTVLPQPDRRAVARVFGAEPAELMRPPTSPPVGLERARAWRVSLPRNPFFAGRTALLDRLHDALAPMGGQTPRIQALSGLAGIGKTQTALESAYRFADQYQAVVWLPADTRDGCLAAVGQLATDLDLPVAPGPDAHDGRTLAAFRGWLRRHERWLVILDNLEEVSILDQIALVGRGSIILTTRAQATGAASARIDLAPLSEAEGAAFVLRRGQLMACDAVLDQASPSDRAAAHALVSRLGGMPLALDQAGAYLEETGCGLAVYLDRFQSQHHLLLKRRGRLARDHPDSVDATLNLAYRRIEQLNPAAAELLCLFAFLHPDAIPEEMLSACAPALGLFWVRSPAIRSCWTRHSQTWPRCRWSVETRTRTV